MKQCKRCSVSKGLELFSKDRTTKDGLSKWCKPCVKVYQSSPRVMEIKRLAQLKYAKTDKGKAAEARHSPKRWERVKTLGRDKVYSMVRHMADRRPCEVCGNTKAQAHHHDYSRPLEVKWLCSFHHAQEHRSAS